MRIFLFCERKREKGGVFSRATSASFVYEGKIRDIVYCIFEIMSPAVFGFVETFSSVEGEGEGAEKYKSVRRLDKS